MKQHWNNEQPIYRQLYDQAISRILEGDLREGEALPSVRTIAADYQLNPITVSKAYQLLADENIVEKKRGLGMFVLQGAQEILMLKERKHFIEHEWPEIEKKILRLNLKPEHLLQDLGSKKSGD